MDEYLKGIIERDNLRVLDQFRGVKPQPSTPETDADPQNPNVRVVSDNGTSRELQFSEGAFDRSPDLARITELEEALKNMMGAYDTPVSRRRFPPDDFMKAAIQSGRDALSQPRTPE